MKRIMIFAVVMGLLIAVASAAIADDEYWIGKFRAGVLSGTTLANYGNTTFGAAPTASVANATAPGNNLANVATYEGSSYYLTNRVVSAGAPYTFNLVLAAGTLYPESQVYISAWSPDKYLNTVNRSIPLDWKMTVTSLDKTIEYASWTGGQLWMAGDPATASTAGPVGFFYTPIKTDAYATSTDRFLVTVAVPTVVDPIPEPGSMLALGSGLVGMAGFALRRRRA